MFLSKINLSNVPYCKKNMYDNTCNQKCFLNGIVQHFYRLSVFAMNYGQR